MTERRRIPHDAHTAPEHHVVWRDDFGVLCASTWGVHTPFPGIVAWRGMAHSVFEAIDFARSGGGKRVYVVEMTSNALLDGWVPWEVYLTAMGAAENLARIQKNPGVCRFRVNTYTAEVAD